MSQIKIETYENRTSFSPGETVRGIVSWQFDSSVRSVEVRLFWYTRGKGTRDVGTMGIVKFDDPGLTDARVFQLALPAGPYSFSGKLISLTWAIEAVVQPGNEAQRLEITVAPGGSEVNIATTAEESAASQWKRWLGRSR